jgi:hypothetical protein
LGVSKRKSIIGLGASANNETIAKVHFRLVIDTSETDADDRFGYTVRLKVSGAMSTKLGKDLVKALRAVPSITAKIPSDKEEFTLPVKSTSGLPGPGDVAAAVPDRVVEWFSKYMSRLIPALDGVLTKA